MSKPKPSPSSRPGLQSETPLQNSDFFWKAALTVGGIAAIGAFVFFGIYRNVLGLKILANLTSGQTFAVIIVALVLTFFALVLFIIAYFKRDPPPEPPSEASERPVSPPLTPAEDPSMEVFPEDLLRAYRSLLFNSRTTMLLLTFVAAHSPIPEKSLVDKVRDQITKGATSQHVRSVLMSLLSAGFLESGGTGISITQLGSRTLTKLINREKKPPVTRDELEGYRCVLGNQHLRYQILAVLASGKSLTYDEIKKAVANTAKDLIPQQVPENSDALDRILQNITGATLVRLQRGRYALSPLGQRFCDDLGVKSSDATVV